MVAPPAAPNLPANRVEVRLRAGVTPALRWRLRPMNDVPRSVKLHRRVMRLAGRDFTVLSPRPSEPLRIANNFFHGTWHLLSHPASAQFVAWLMWHVGHERRHNTLAVIDQRFLVPNPFDGDTSDPVVIMNSNLGTPGRRGLAHLSDVLPLGRSEGTVRMDVRSIDEWYEDCFWRPAHQRRHRIDSVNGLVVITAPGPRLLELASTGLRISAEHGYGGYRYMDWPEVTGEFQVFLDFDARVQAAVARRQKLFPGDTRPKLPVTERELVWRA